MITDPMNLINNVTSKALPDYQTRQPRNSKRNLQASRSSTIWQQATKHLIPMKSRICIKYLVLSSALVLFSMAELVSQTSAKVSPTERDTIIPGDAVSKHSLFSGAGYGSNMIYMGSTLSKNQPYGYAALSYGYKEALYATVSSVHLSGMDPLISFNIASLNYNHVFNSWFDISAGFYGYQVEKSLTDNLFNNFLYGDFTLGVDWKLLYSKLSAGILLSEESLTFFQLRNSRYFRTPEFFKKRFYISFDPYVNILLGSLDKQEILSGTSVSSSSVYRR